MALLSRSSSICCCTPASVGATERTRTFCRTARKAAVSASGAVARARMPVRNCAPG